MIKKKEKDKLQKEEFNKFCKSCIKKCKQFTNVEIIECAKYETKK